ncbi:GNAT family N-acetyltransferase [Methanobacterium oryzae]|uniref:GNAT family N-acetyltransferase n=1 Tax=Methanobacterium oryzae TaxID=69540 RepID=UPI003D1DACAF
MDIRPQKFPELNTKRLILRELRIDDAKTLFKYWSDNEVTKYLNMESFVTMQQTFRMIRVLINLFKHKEGIRWAIVRKEDNVIIGTCGFNSWIPKGSRGEIGYELGRIYWGNGYATESLKEILRYGFEEIKLNRIEAFTVPKAHKSIKLLKKLGFKKEGTLREYGYWNNQYQDENIYSLLKRDWILINKD